jgi:hypothetical protein
MVGRDQSLLDVARARRQKASLLRSELDEQMFALKYELSPNHS